MKRALITGGAGFIGSHLARRLADEGVQVRILDNLSTGDMANLEGVEVDFRVEDIRNWDAVEEAVAGVEIVFHHAALVSVPESMDQPLRCYDINLMGSINLLEASLRSGVRRVVLASSSAVYGEREGPVSEDEAGDPLSPYAASKRAMESAAGVYAAAYGLPTVSLRYFNVYGPCQPSNSPYAAVIPRFIEALLQGKSPVIFGDGQQSRDFAYVEDVVSCNLLAAHADPPVSGVFNVGGGGSITINELAALLVEMIPGGKPPEYGPPRPGDIRHSRADLGKIQERLNFQPETELVSGLQRTVEWFRSNR